MEENNVRMNAGYRIINAIQAGNTEYVLGFNRNAPSQYVTWQCRGKEDYIWGHYMDSQLDAVKDLCGRVIEEIRYLEEKEKGHFGKSRESNDILLALVEHKGGRVLIQFPTRELGESLRSIGIELSPKEVYSSGNPDIKVQMIHEGGRVPEAFIRLLGEHGSLHTVNELAKAVYHSDWRVSELLEENLSKDIYDSPEAFLEDAVKYKEKIKEHDKKRKICCREER